MKIPDEFANAAKTFEHIRSGKIPDQDYGYEGYGTTVCLRVSTATRKERKTR